MSASEAIVKAEEKDVEVITQLALKLWPDNTYESLYVEMQELIQSSQHQILLYWVGDNPVAFIHLSIRNDYVEGSTTSPTGYLEGIYVEEAYRNQGIGRKLLLAGEKWLREKGCIQIGSDILLDNTNSYQFHKQVGFQEVSRLITFIKDL